MSFLKLFRKESDDSYEFKPLLVEIEEKPQNPLGKSILWIVVIIIFFTIAWLCLAKIDVVVSARGKIIPSGEIKILQPLENGVLSKILVKEGDRVKQGDIIMQIDPSVSSANLQSKELELLSLKSAITRLSALSYQIDINATEINQDELNLYIHQQQMYSESIEQYNHKISQAKFALNSTKSDEKRLRDLHSQENLRLNKLKSVKDIIAGRDYDNALKATLDSKEQLNISISKTKEAASKLLEIEKEKIAFIENSKSKWLDELNTKQTQLNTVNAEISAIKFQSQKQQITSPVDGFVGKIMFNTEGGVVTTSEKLVSIIPSNTPLIISAQVLNKDIGFLKPGMHSAIKIDTFNFQKYGKLDANLTHISNDAIEDEKLGPVFEIKLSPLKDYLIIEGEAKQIEPGMSVTAEIKIDKRRVIEFFIYPIIKYLDEGLSVR